MSEELIQTVYIQVQYNSIYRSGLRYTPLLYLILPLFIFGCKDKSVDVDPVRNPREYKWTVDTLTYPGVFQIDLRSMWGTSSKDLWICGWNSGGPGKIWHYDGNKWNAIDHRNQIGGAVAIEGLYGFASNDIWAVGYRMAVEPDQDETMIIHYDGNRWKEYPLKKSYTQLYDVWGSAPNDIWACGYDSSAKIYHYDGNKWNEDTIKIPRLQNRGVYYYSPRKVGSDLILLAGGIKNNREINYCIEKSLGNWAIVDSFENNPKWGSAGLYLTRENKLWSYFDGIFEWRSSSWNKIYSISNDVRAIAGNDKDNILLACFNSGVYHYNGVDWHRLENFHTKNIYLSNAWADDKEAFIVGGDGLKAYVWHGK